MKCEELLKRLAEYASMAQLILLFARSSRSTWLDATPLPDGGGQNQT